MIQLMSLRVRLNRQRYVIKNNHFGSCFRPKCSNGLMSLFPPAACRPWDTFFVLLWVCRKKVTENSVHVVAGKAKVKFCGKLFGNCWSSGRLRTEKKNQKSFNIELNCIAEDIYQFAFSKCQSSICIIPALEYLSIRVCNPHSLNNFRLISNPFDM